MMLLIALFSFRVIGLVQDKSNENQIKEVSKIEYQKFYLHTQSRLPAWRSSFKKYAQQNDIPWTLLAAVAYQESKWDQMAVSHTGVKGMMQITRSTAEYIGIDDREDPIQSIKGGAFYLKYLYSKTPANLSNFEKWAQALAAYNMGWAHLRDARRLALELNHSPNQWKEFKKIIPKLEEEKYNSNLTFGYARGRETVQFVDGVMGYYKLLNQSSTLPLLTSRDF